MAIVITPLGFQKPDGNELVRNGDNVIAANAQKAQDLLSDARARLANLDNAAGFTGDPLALNDSAVAQAMSNGTEARAALDGRLSVQVPPVVAAAIAADPTIATAAATMAQSNAGLLPKWKASTAYTAGQQVAAPNGDIVSAKINFTSGATYSAANWNASTNDGRIGAVEAKNVEQDARLDYKIDGGSFDSTDLSYAMVDENGRQAWIEAGMDGEPTPRVIASIEAQQATQAGTSIEDGFAIVDANYRMTEIDVDGAGQIKPYVLAAWKQRMAVTTATVPIVPTALSAALKNKIITINNNAAKYHLLTYLPSAYPGTGPITNFGLKGQDQIRPPATMAMGLAAMIATSTYDPAITTVSLADATATCKRLITSLAAQHAGNTAGGWGGALPPWAQSDAEQAYNVPAWQSALWVAFTGTAAWLIWGQLSAGEQASVSNMLAKEADRFLTYKAPYWRDRAGVEQFAGDSKMEESEWNASCLSVALLVVPNHANAHRWMEKFLELTLSATAAPSDITATETAHSYPLGDMLDGWNINEDGTLYNHGIIQPNYIAAAGQSWFTGVLFAWSGKKIPAGCFRNGHRIYRSLIDVSFGGKTIYTPGSYAIYYPQGDDGMGVRVSGYYSADVLAAVFGLDKTSSVPASTWADLHLQRQLDLQARQSTGGTYLPGEEGAQATISESVVFYNATWSLLAAFQAPATVRTTNLPPAGILMQNRSIN